MTGIPVVFPFFLCQGLRFITWVLTLPWEPACFPPPDLCCRKSKTEAPASRVDPSVGIHILARLQQVGPLPPDFLL